MSWSSRKKKEGIFVVFVLPKGNFFKICVLFQCIMQWIYFQNTYTFTYKKHYFTHFCCLFLKSSKAFTVSINFVIYQDKKDFAGSLSLICSTSQIFRLTSCLAVTQLSALVAYERLRVLIVFCRSKWNMKTQNRNKCTMLFGNSLLLLDTKENANL